MLALYCYRYIMLLLFNTKPCSLNRYYSHLPPSALFLNPHVPRTPHVTKISSSDKGARISCLLFYYIFRSTESQLPRSFECYQLAYIRSHNIKTSLHQATMIPAPAVRCKSDIRRKLHWEKESPPLHHFLGDITRKSQILVSESTFIPNTLAYFWFNVRHSSRSSLGICFLQNLPKEKCFLIHSQRIIYTNIIKMTSLVAWWSELLTTNHEVPCSIPGSTMCVFS